MLDRENIIPLLREVTEDSVQGVRTFELKISYYNLEVAYDFYSQDSLLTAIAKKSLVLQTELKKRNSRLIALDKITSKNVRSLDFATLLSCIVFGREIDKLAEQVLVCLEEVLRRKVSTLINFSREYPEFVYIVLTHYDSSTVLKIHQQYLEGKYWSKGFESVLENVWELYAVESDA